MIRLHVRGGYIVPLRNESRATTTALKGMDFSILVAQDKNGLVGGVLHRDDGISLVREASIEISFKWEKGSFSMSGTFDSGLEWRLRRLLFRGSRLGREV